MKQKISKNDSTRTQTEKELTNTALLLSNQGNYYDPIEADIENDAQCTAKEIESTKSNDCVIKNRTKFPKIKSRLADTNPFVVTNPLDHPTIENYMTYCENRRKSTIYPINEIDDESEIAKYFDDESDEKTNESVGCENDYLDTDYAAEIEPDSDDLLEIDAEVLEETIEYEESLKEQLSLIEVDELHRNNEDVLAYLRNNRDILTENEIELIYNDFFNKNKKIIYWVINKYNRYYVNDDADNSELFGMGQLGFAKALDKFDPNFGVKFTTFAIRCIKNEINFLSKKEKKHFDNNVSMSQPRYHDKNGKEVTYEDTVADPSLNPEEQLHEEERNRLVREGINKLDPLEKYIIYTRYGFDRGQKYTQKDIANITKMSQANISKIENGCHKKLSDIYKTILN